MSVYRFQLLAQYNGFQFSLIEFIYSIFAQTSLSTIVIWTIYSVESTSNKICSQHPVNGTLIFIQLHCIEVETENAYFVVISVHRPFKFQPWSPLSVLSVSTPQPSLSLFYEHLQSSLLREGPSGFVELNVLFGFFKSFPGRETVFRRIELCMFLL